jgi:hypothetical protein
MRVAVEQLADLLQRLALPETASTLCDLGVFAYEAAETVSL